MKALSARSRSAALGARRVSQYAGSPWVCGRGFARRSARRIVRGGFLWEIVRIFTHYFILPVVARDLHAEIFINVEGQGLIGDILQGIDQDPCGNADLPAVFGLNVQLNTHYGLQVGGHH